MLSLDTLPRAQLLTMVIVSRTAGLAPLETEIGFPRNARLNLTIRGVSRFCCGKRGCAHSVVSSPYIILLYESNRVLQSSLPLVRTTSQVKRKRERRGV